MHQRRDKEEPLDTVLYEIDMLRHCASTLADKKERAKRSGSDYDNSEYYLDIEGFLLHLRNLLAFLTNRRDHETDLVINAPEQWAGRPIEQREYSDLIKAAKEINQNYGAKDSTCYDQISKFLQHCTTYRHEQIRRWDVEDIFKELDPVLKDFERRFAPAMVRPRRSPDVSGMLVHNTTATFRTCSILVDPSREK